MLDSFPVVYMGKSARKVQMAEGISFHPNKIVAVLLYKCSILEQSVKPPIKKNNQWFSCFFLDCVSVYKNRLLYLYCTEHKLYIPLKPDLL